MSRRILVMAGEPSGDLHGARVVSALAELMPDAEIDAVGGPRMARAGATIRRSIDGLAAMGFVEILHKIPAHLGLLRRLRRDFAAHRYDLVVTVDYPGFHLRVAQAAKRAGIPVLAYIAPQLWAWRPGRADRWSRAVDRMAVILPFETDFFRTHGIEATYVGHPLVDGEATVLIDRAAARAALGLGADSRVLALFPGSREGEITRLWPLYRAAALRLRAMGRVDEIVVAGTAEGQYPGAEGMHVAHDASALALAAADAALVKSGTTTLEAAIADVPMVVAYRLHPLTYHLARRLVTVPWVSLVNLITERAVVPELVQHAVTVDRLVDAIAPLLDPTTPEAIAQRAGLAEARRRLGGPGASRRVAGLALELLPACG
jgi:lipid-A-disaccharide synthase